MKKNYVPFTETLILLIGEILVSLLVIGGYLLVDLAFKTEYFSYRVITGALLGSLVIVLNYFFLSLFLNRAVNNFMAMRGKDEMDEESAAKFAAEHMAPIRKTITVSMMVRTFSMLAALVVAFILDWFAPIATVIPILAFRPILTVSSILQTKKNAVPENFIFVPTGGEALDADEPTEDGEALIAEKNEEREEGSV